MFSWSSIWGNQRVGGKPLNGDTGGSRRRAEARGESTGRRKIHERAEWKLKGVDGHQPSWRGRGRPREVVMLALNRLLVRSRVIHGQSPVIDIGVTHLRDPIIIKSKNTFVLIFYPFHLMILAFWLSCHNRMSMFNQHLSISKKQACLGSRLLSWDKCGCLSTQLLGAWY